MSQKKKIMELVQTMCELEENKAKLGVSEQQQKLAEIQGEIVRHEQKLRDAGEDVRARASEGLSVAWLGLMEGHREHAALVLQKLKADKARQDQVVSRATSKLQQAQRETEKMERLRKRRRTEEKRKRDRKERQEMEEHSIRVVGLKKDQNR